MNKSFAEELNQFFTLYLPKEINASSNTIVSYKQTFKLLINYLVNEKKIELKNINFSSITRDVIKDFLIYLEEEKHSSINTRNQRLAAIKSFYQYIKLEDPSSLDNIQSILSIKTKKCEIKLQSYLTLNEIKDFFDAIDTTNKIGKRNLALLSLLYDSGARVSEITALKLIDIHLDDKPYITLLGKGQKYRNVPIMDKTKELLLVYLKDKSISNTSYLFSNSKNGKLSSRSIQFMINNYARKSGCIKNISPHSFRRSRAMHLLQAGVNIVYIRDLLGHCSILTTERYARANEEIKRNAILNAYPDVFDNIEVNSWNKDEDLLKDLLSL